MDISRFETLLVERRGAVDWVTLNRPGKLGVCHRRCRVVQRQAQGCQHAVHLGGAPTKIADALD